MKEEFENELYKIDPVFFEHAIACKEGKENQMTTCMYFGCECGDGWFEPIKKFVKKIAIINNIAKLYNIKFVCDQIKEKYGEFTCYFNSHLIDENKSMENEQSDILNEIFREALKKCEDECWNICEWCGADGGFQGENLVNTSGWINRICKKCAKAKAEKVTQNYDEINKQEYVPRITWFHDGYEFLNLYHINTFRYKDSHYHSIIEAFYCEKDKAHYKLYKKIVNGCKDSSSYLVEDLAKEFGFTYEDNENDYNLMKDIIKSKFSYQMNHSLKEELIETDGKLLQNMGKHHNNILGHCICNECKDKGHKDLYAKMLMEVREELKNGKKQ